MDNKDSHHFLSFHCAREVLSALCGLFYLNLTTTLILSSSIVIDKDTESQGDVDQDEWLGSDRVGFEPCQN